MGENGWPRVELYIERGFEYNKRAFELLRVQQNQIEKEMGQPLSWEGLPEARRIAVYTDGRIEDSPEHLGQPQDWAVEVLGRFVRVFRPRVAALPKDLEQMGDAFASEAAKKAWEARREGWCERYPGWRWLLSKPGCKLRTYDYDKLKT